MSSVEERQRGMSCPMEELESRGLLRRGMGTAIGVEVWEGMVLIFGRTFWVVLSVGKLSTLRIICLPEEREAALGPRNRLYG